MNAHLDTALALPLEDAVRATHAAAVNAAFLQAQRLLGERPRAGAAPDTGPRSDTDPDPDTISDADADADTDTEERNLAIQVLAFRIEHAAGLDAVGSVVGLRRWGVTWDTLGRAVGMSRQAAHHRWGAQVRATLDRYGTGEPGGPVADDEEDLGR